MLRRQEVEAEHSDNFGFVKSKHELLNNLDSSKSLNSSRKVNVSSQGSTGQKKSFAKRFHTSLIRLLKSKI